MTPDPDTLPLSRDEYVLEARTILNAMRADGALSGTSPEGMLWRRWLGLAADFPEEPRPILKVTQPLSKCGRWLYAHNVLIGRAVVLKLITSADYTRFWNLTGDVIAWLHVQAHNHGIQFDWPPPLPSEQPDRKIA